MTAGIDIMPIYIVGFDSSATPGTELMWQLRQNGVVIARYRR
ncbi:hypothetical protein D083_3525 [Dickeya solani RNS 08.23.3.1.A]|nr:hypothetical protein D083_3525 [Dickeya solani RNS 08.23.3.1.A]